MAEIIRFNPSPHERAQQLLSWYANGTLEGDEASSVAAHLAECDQCRSDLAFEQVLRAEVAALPLDQEQGWSAMEQRLAARDRQPAARRFLRRRVPIGWALGGPVAALAASLLLFLSVGAGERTVAPAGEYRALSGPSTSTAGNMLVIFSPQAPEREVRALLLANRATLVDGPNASGAYLLRVDQARRQPALAALRAAPQVLLAEPVDADFTP